jgi:hypothetical protein
VASDQRCGSGLSSVGRHDEFLGICGLGADAPGTDKQEPRQVVGVAKGSRRSMSRSGSEGSEASGCIEWAPLTKIGIFLAARFRGQPRRGLQWRRAKPRSRRRLPA